MLAAIGEPELDRHAQRSAPRPDLRQSRHPALSGVPRVLRHGGRDRPDRRVLQACRAGSGRTQADPLPARTGRRRQVVDRRAAEGADGAAPIYALKGSPVNESPLGLFAPERFGAVARGRLRHPAALPHRHHVAVGGQAPAGIRRRHFQVPRRAREPVGAAPDRDHQDRARRREQPGHLLAGRQGRHPQARTASRRTIRTPTATREGCASPTRGCSNSSRCSRRRSRCCIRC